MWAKLMAKKKSKASTKTGKNNVENQRRSMSAFMLDQSKHDFIHTDEFNRQYEILKDFFSPNSTVRRKAGIGTLKRSIQSSANDKLSPMDKYALSLTWQSSISTIPGYATLHETHVKDIESLITAISQYADDKTKHRPLNFLLLASPGSGKSHLVDCVTSQLSHYKVASHSFNMASMLSPEDLVAPLDEVRNSKVADNLPLLFLDEFDSAPSNYGLLLPLLWDGTLTLRQRHLKLGRMIVVLAGSSPLLPQALAEARTMRSGLQADLGPNAKMLDLMSRINGAVLTVPALESNDEARQLDKVVIAVQLIARRFPAVQAIALGILRMISHTHFRYDVRSISHFIDQLSPPSGRALTCAHAPASLGDVNDFRQSSLIYHIIDDIDNAHGVVSKWKHFRENDELVPTKPPTTFQQHRKKIFAWLSVTDLLTSRSRHQESCKVL